MPHTDKTCYDRTRLYFLVYICDHHVSLSHGRPPMTREFRGLKEPRILLESNFSTALDIQLVSQVELWSISSQVFDKFGAATDSTFNRRRLSDLESLNDTYQHWRCNWETMLETQLQLDPSILTFLDLYFHSARLYLSTHIFRGPKQDFARPEDSPNPFHRFGQLATQSALSIVHTITEMIEAQVSIRLPFYFSTMLSFASIFLLKGPCRTLYHVARDRSMQYLQALNRFVSIASAIPNTAHPLPSIASNLKTVIDGFGEAEAGNGGESEDHGANIGMNCDNGIRSTVYLYDQECTFFGVWSDLPGFQDYDYNCVQWDFGPWIDISLVKPVVQVVILIPLSVVHDPDDWLRNGNSLSS